jgi:hypothetical protein
MLQQLCAAGMDCFMDTPGSQKSYKGIVVQLVALLVSIVVVAFVGKYLWNASVSELFTFARPVQSVWQIIALMLLLSILR